MEDLLVSCGLICFVHTAPEGLQYPIIKSNRAGINQLALSQQYETHKGAYQ